MKLPSIAVVLNRVKINNKSGMYSIYIRITLERQSKYIRIPTPQKISLNDWNNKNKADNYVKSSNSFAFEINNKIKDYKSKIDEVIRRHCAQNKTITFDAIEQGIKKKGDNMVFNNYVSEYIKNPKEKLDDTTLTKYKTFLMHLNSFNSKIYFRDLSPELVKDFKNYLQSDLKLAGSIMKL